ncbi:hypothetical protein KP05_01375 [Cobetia amphilecti]|uniref:biosynthetic peptidoglycan transglycosylase n=1 Tax=Cobetia amphilecti TaxID=1055104 RepID=UPI0004FFD252|nr:biosynthetic peptidoglycan transglycosylase [Cobetia amphilecti]KGA03475.1 hypothetical protein KP05_01375 [Cobetia amphilecti]
MNSGDNQGWKQHYPTFKFDNNEMILEEYRSASKTLETEEKVFLSAANIAIVIGAAFGSLTLGKLESITGDKDFLMPVESMLFAILIITILFTVLFLFHFAARQKSIVYAARKVVVLRTVLGVKYGEFQLVLPNWRIEGANEPFAIRMFPGWKSYVAYPCYAISGISAFVIYFILTILLDVGGLSIVSTLNADLVVSVPASFLAFFAFCFLYRHALLDKHESMLLIFTQYVSKLLSLNVEERIEHIVYHAKLSVYEAKRLNIDLKALKRIAVEIEDKEFYRHSGVSWKGLARVILSSLKLHPRSGGSTITQQLVRTLFIKDFSKTKRRKIVEILLAKWFTKVIDKDEQLDMYLSSVRYEFRVMGIIQASKHFFGGIERSFSIAQSFFLIERLSNVRSKVYGKRIRQILQALLDDDKISMDDVVKIVEIYGEMVAKGLVENNTTEGVEYLRNSFCNH